MPSPNKKLTYEEKNMYSIMSAKTREQFSWKPNGSFSHFCLIIRRKVLTEEIVEWLIKNYFSWIFADCRVELRSIISWPENYSSSTHFKVDHLWCNCSKLFKIMHASKDTISKCPCPSICMLEGCAHYHLLEPCQPLICSVTKSFWGHLLENLLLNYHQDKIKWSILIISYHYFVSKKCKPQFTTCRRIWCRHDRLLQVAA